MTTGRPSHLSAAVRLAIAGVRRRGRDESQAPLEPARKLAVERHGITITLAHLQRYLAATRAADLYVGAPAVPATYAAVWETALTLELLSRDGMPFPSEGIVHMSSEIVVVRPIRIDDRVRCRLELERVEAHSRGAVLVVRSRSWNEAGQLCQENSTRLLVRGGRIPPGAVRRAGEGEAGERPEGAASTWRELTTWPLSGGAGVRYARASGDFNPIHLWPWSSRLFGFPRPVLHGHCSLAMIAHELTRATGRTPRRLDGNFRVPLALPATVRLEISGELDQGAVALRLVDGSGTGKPFVQGKWVG